METMTLEAIFIRLTLTLITTGIIGYNRLRTGQSAGIRTHVLVGVGSCIIALIQVNLRTDAINFAIANPDYAELVNSDSSRLIAQVISGIGFLGAGTIIVTKNVTISGLTTAASLWTVAGIGIAFGLGYWEIGFIGSVFIWFALVILNIFKSDKVYLLDIYFDRHRTQMKDLFKLFESYGLMVDDMNIFEQKDNKYHYQFRLLGDRFQVDIDQIAQSIWSKVANVVQVDFNNEK